MLKLLLIALAWLALTSFVFAVHVHHGNNMYPFVMDGDVVVSFRPGGIRTGDAVLYRRPDGSLNVSRMAALPGSSVDIRENGSILINGYVPNEKVFYPTELPEDTETSYPLETGEGCFLLDDYRPGGYDSRSFGAVPKKDVLGRIVYVIRRRGI